MCRKVSKFTVEQGSRSLENRLQADVHQKQTWKTCEFSFVARHIENFCHQNDDEFVDFSMKF